jgi:YkgG family uncharacterized protein
VAALTTRAEFLRRLPAPTVVGSPAVPPVRYRDAGGGVLGDTGMLDLFRHRWEGLGGGLHVATAAQVPDVVAAIVDGRGPVLVTDDPVLAGVAGELRWPECGIGGAAEASVAVVAAVAALAATGSVLLDSRLGRGRSAALLAPLAVFVVRESTVVGHLGAVLRHVDERWPDGLPSQLVAVSGPSRSADIEHTLTRGVHGPGDVHAVVVTA